MTGAILTTMHYDAHDGQVSWHGVSMADEDNFNTFMTNDVASRLNDEEGATAFESQLRTLATTGFARDSLSAILAAEIPEERAWAVGEAVAEAYLSCEHHITWPWNMARDKRTARASLPGADLIGFETSGDDIRLVLGEVKTSADTGAPPNVMNGRSGMTHQIDNLAADLSLIVQLIKWLWPRCKGTDHEASFNVAVTAFLNSSHKAFALFGILVRDTEPNERDLRGHAKALAKTLNSPTTCCLVALYLPCAIADLPTRAGGGG